MHVKNRTLINICMHNQQRTKITFTSETMHTSKVGMILTSLFSCQNKREIGSYVVELKNKALTN